MSNATVMTPRPHMSHGEPRCEPPNHTSGARTYSVETCSDSNDNMPAAGVLHPRPHIFTISSRRSMMFAMLRSMCAIPVWCNNAKPLHIWWV